MATEVKKSEKKGQVVPRFPAESMMGDLLDEMDRFWRLPLLRRRPFFSLLDSDKSWLPSVDVYEKKGNLVIKADLPGAKKEDVDVSVEEGNLIIQGERKEESKVEEENYYRMERTSGRFYRSMKLPDGVNPDDIKAEFKDGVLEVQVPIPAEEQKKKKKVSRIAVK